MTISVSIVDDDRDLRQTLARYLDIPGFQCLSTHPNAEEAIRELPALKPNVILMDINLPRQNGIECAAQLKALAPASKCIMLTAFEDTDSIFRALSAGALGYMLKGVRPAKLLESIKEVHQGGSPMSHEIARKVVLSFQKTAPPQSADVRLSEREEQVLNLLVQGLLYKQIADRLAISQTTVRTYAQRIYEKLQVHTRTEAVVKYLNR